MKLRVFCKIVPIVMTIGTAGAAEIYNKDGNKLHLFGKIDGLHYFSDNSSQDGDQSYMRFGLRGETQINEQLIGYGEWEYQVQLNRTENENDAFTRVGFAGLKFGDYGSLDYGRNYGVMYDIGSWTDVLPEFGGDTYGADNFLFQRTNGVLTYRNSNFFGLVDSLDFAMQFQGKNGNAEETNNSRDVLGQNGNGYGMSISYGLGYGISAASAFFISDRTNDQNGNSSILGRGDRAEAYSGGLKYDANNVYLAAMYTQSYNATRFGSSKSTAYGYANKAQNFEVVAQYQFDFGLRPSLAYLQSKGKDIERGYSNQDLMKYVDIGATYHFNKNMSTYVDYKINLLDDNDFTMATGINTDNVVAIGLVYQF
ncbi:porin OmpC [Serratia oryzae]|uniref:Porin OmpC n=1 Tax=Serratia oryzae TaxID=2034155 RepID=A0A1S8CQP8_9GAMM|nr:porin OmpC [Serratia oryzae]OMQ26758.1 porin OmpC [Serratia oryzae]